MESWLIGVRGPAVSQTNQYIHTEAGVGAPRPTPVPSVPGPASIDSTQVTAHINTPPPYTIQHRLYPT